MLDNHKYTSPCETNRTARKESNKTEPRRTARKEFSQNAFPQKRIPSTRNCKYLAQRIPSTRIPSKTHSKYLAQKPTSWFLFSSSLHRTSCHAARTRRRDSHQSLAVIRNGQRLGLHPPRIPRSFALLFPVPPTRVQTGQDLQQLGTTEGMAPRRLKFWGKI